MKRILFVIQTLGGGGAEKVLLNLLDNINYDKYKIDLLTISDEGVYKNKINPNVEKFHIFKGTDSIESKLSQNIYKLYRRIYMKIIEIKPNIISKKIKNRKYDIEISFLEGLGAIIVANRDCDKKISWIHTDLSKYESIISKEKLEESYSKMDKILFVSEEAKKGFLKVFPIFEAKNDILDVIYNPIDEEQIKLRAKEQINYNKKAITLIAIGRLIKSKRIDRLVKIHKRLLDEGIKHEFVILGEGQEKKQLDALINELEVADTFKLIGFTDNPYKWINMADIYTMSSEYEGLPLVIAEAMTLNKPIVSTGVTGPNEMLHFGEYGMLTENNIDSLYDGIKEMILNENLRNQYIDKLKCKKSEFDKHEIINKIEHMLDNL
ncbi:glycosyltransferase [Paraclostridium sordellii]|uniref:glycosyltransferase n=1 Tax=Paraclostridium sordellii TaxID=1505 RepID=UPI0005DDFD78|nr:glycosyltransferase [Paeniclostridium sordellii]CEN89674.1 lipopolysaccharide biosynthesis protein [[Clostridium] sordellii] [Paeniclostridium sordellii]CEQ13324.1 lipopolysaccharide biosynthesis protein [[Clostridium] sordellii] [Paeniclostridium sordellii]